MWFTGYFTESFVIYYEESEHGGQFECDCKANAVFAVNALTIRMAY